MMDFIKTKKNYIIALAVLFVFVSLSETTYSLFLKSDTTDEFNYNTGILDLQFTEDNQIVLDNTLPISDTEGERQKPYNLTIKNTGDIPYLFDLKMISDGKNTSIDYKYIKVKVNDYLPHTLYSTNNVIASKLLIYPQEEMTFKIKIWLDKDTPNNELGKSFNAKIVTSGSSAYKTIDNSGANHPNLNDEMIPIYYDTSAKTWRLADHSNTDTNNTWYNYANKEWANSATVKNSTKYIYDITRNNDLAIDNVTVNNGNIIIDNNYLDIKLNNYNYDTISTVVRIKFDDLKNNNYIISNGNISYYYDNENKKFVIKNGNNTVISNEVNIEKNTWYIVGYTYDGSNAKFYLDGNNIGSSNLTGKISSGDSFKLGTNNLASETSKITVGDLLIYYNVLKENEFSNNYKTSMNIITDGLVTGYTEFSPMTLKEYYMSSEAGTTIRSNDINAYYVWIPRYKYMVWNVLGEENTDSYDAYHKGIKIEFEKGTTTSGIISCKNNECFGDNLGITKISSDDNGKYYTHPAFTTNTKELTGFWVSKYEISKDESGVIESIPNSIAWTNDYLSNYYQQVLKMSDTENYRVIKNTEWGAIAYLSHSNYGLCQNDKCNEIGTNQTYTSGVNESDTTTGNIYGVYDLAGSAIEYTMSNYADSNNDLNLNNALFKDVAISNDDYNLYTKDSFILGDATKEISITGGIWYNNTNNNINDVNNWIIRGGNTTESYKGIFAYSATNDITSEYITTRIVSR